MAVDSDYSAIAMRLIEERLRPLRRLTFTEAAALPETCGGEDISVGGAKASITVFRLTSPYQPEGRVLVTVLVACPRWFGMTSYHIERGLVFSPEEAARDATDLELQNSGS